MDGVSEMLLLAERVSSKLNAMRILTAMLLTFLVIAEVRGQATVPCDQLPQSFACDGDGTVDTLNLSMLDSLLVVGGNDSCSLWQVASSHKPVFDSISSSIGLITDSVNAYGMGLSCSFVLRTPCTHNTYIMFEHKVDTDTLEDGGFVEISWDQGETWAMAGDLYTCCISYHNYLGLNDMYGGQPNGGENVPLIGDSIPAFSGRQGWMWSGLGQYGLPMKTDFCWDNDSESWFRFTFKSDSSDSGKAGWMIRKIVVIQTIVYGDVGENSMGALKLHPNPTANVFRLELPPNAPPLREVILHDLSGREVLRQMDTNEMDATSLQQGIYVVTAITDQGMYRQRLVVQH